MDSEEEGQDLGERSGGLEAGGRGRSPAWGPRGSSLTSEVMGMMTFVPGAVSAGGGTWALTLPGSRCFCLGVEWGVIGGQLRGRISPLGQLEHRITPLLLFTSLRSEGFRPILAGRSLGWRPAVRRESEKAV